MSEERKRAFEQGRAAFVPDASDNPECIPYYAAYAGLRAAWGAAFCDKYDGLVHRAFCTAGGRNGDAYDVAVATVKEMAERAKVPERPVPRYRYIREPEEPTEEQAYAFFKAEFKRAFPDRRVNSAFAKEQWQRVQEKASAILREQYEKDLGAYQKEIERLDAENEAEHAAYQEKIRGIEQMKADVAAICA